MRFFKFHFLRFMAVMINEASPIEEYFNINWELEQIEAWHFFGKSLNQSLSHLMEENFISGK